MRLIHSNSSGSELEIEREEGDILRRTHSPSVCHFPPSLQKRRREGAEGVQDESERENSGVAETMWNFRPNQQLEDAAQLSIRGVMLRIMSYLEAEDSRPTIPLGHGDSSAFPSFRTTPIAQDAVVSALRFAAYNSYSPHSGILPARK